MFRIPLSVWLLGWGLVAAGCVRTVAPISDVHELIDVADSTELLAAAEADVGKPAGKDAKDAVGQPDVAAIEEIDVGDAAGEEIQDVGPADLLGDAAEVTAGGDATDVALPADVKFAPFKWKKISKMKQPRMRAKAAWGGDFLYVWGGKVFNCCQDPKAQPAFTDGILNSVERYDPKTDTWTQLPMPPTYPDAKGSLVWGGDRLYLFSDSTDWNGPTPWTKSPVPYVSLKPGDAAWQPLPSKNSPGRRSSPAVAWVGDRLFVWGSNNQSPPPEGSGGTYDPKTDSWTPLPMAPTITGEHDSVYGLVWNGTKVSFGTAKARLEFDPATNQWTDFPSSASAGPNGKLLGPWAWTSVPFGSAFLGKGSAEGVNAALWLRSDGKSEKTEQVVPTWAAKTDLEWLGTIKGSVCAVRQSDAPQVINGACFDLASSTWSALAQADPTYSRYQAAIAQDGNRIAAVSGVGGSEQLYGEYWLWADGWILEPTDGGKP